MYQLGKASKDFRAFAGHLEGARIAERILDDPVTLEREPRQPSKGGETAGEDSQGSSSSEVTTNDREGTTNEAISDAARAWQGGQHPIITKEWAWKHARENVIMVTWSNFHFVDFVENWAAHLATHRALLMCSF